jgi:proteasome lid subunit RPN8/RPN11
MLKIPRSLLQQIIRHAQHELPLEAVGILAGKNGVASRVYELTNEERQGYSYRISREEQADTLADVQRRDLQMTAIYHSHVDAPAYPSYLDREAAQDPTIYHVIVSLAGRQPAVRVYRIRYGQVTEAGLQILEH